MPEKAPQRLFDEGIEPKPRPTAQTRRANKQTDCAPEPAARRGHTFPASIQIVIDESATLSTRVQEWLARCVAAFLQAVKHQLALLAAPPERPLLPPTKHPDEEDHDGSRRA